MQAHLYMISSVCAVTLCPFIYINIQVRLVIPVLFLIR